MSFDILLFITDIVYVHPPLPLTAFSPVIADRFTPRTAWRAWYLRRNGHALASLHRLTHDLWLGCAAKEARCEDSDSAGLDSAHTAPMSACRCGIYATSEPYLAFSESDQGPTVVMGKVALWGKMQDHPLGWRAQYAYPSALYVHPNLLERVGGTLAHTYQVSVHSRDLINRALFPHPVRTLINLFALSNAAFLVAIFFSFYTKQVLFNTNSALFALLACAGMVLGITPLLLENMHVRLRSGVR